jgi:hypothetical protein
MAAAAAGGAYLAGPAPAAPAVGRARLSKVGAQLYTVRRELERDFAGTLAAVAALGYREVEFAGYFGRTPAEVKAALARSDLAAPAAHVPLAALRGGALGRALEAAHLVGHKYLVVAYLAPAERGTLDDYRRLADLFNEAGGAGGRGVRLPQPRLRVRAPRRARPLRPVARTHRPAGGEV